jgi:hypothetical protein
LPLGVELVFLVADLAGPFDALQAVESAIEVFEVIIDSLSFELGTVIRVGQFEVIDLTAPAHVDDERELRVFSGPPYGTNISSVEMESIHGAVQVTLPDKVPQYDARTAAALRWFNKSMSTNLLHDVFIFLWIALEILVDLSPISVEAPYQARCNHFIKHCPECGSPTAKEVRGPTIRQYLEVSFGVDPQVARDLWRMRQMMHGSINFEPAKLHDLPTLVQPLRASVAEGIKRRLGIAAYAAPIIAASGFSINPAMGAEGTRKLTADDLQSLLDKISEPAEKTGSGSRDSEPEDVASAPAIAQDEPVTAEGPDS